MEDMYFRKAFRTDSREIYDLMQEVYKKLEDSTLFVCDGFKFIDALLSDDEKGFGVVALNFKQEIIAALLLRIPGLDEENLGRDIGLPEEELRRVIHFESTVVHPAYRGRNILEKMLRIAEQWIDIKKYFYFMATVSPCNPASFKSLEKNGYRPVLKKEKYGGLVRNIYLKKIECNL